jgi:hypothetical protein
MRWLVVGLSVLALIVLGTVAWILSRGAGSIIVLLMFAALAGIVLAASNWGGWQLVQGLVVATLLFLGLALALVVLGSSLAGY